MSDSKSCTIRTRNFLGNRLLQRRQFVLDVIHPGRANVPKAELKKHIATMFKVEDEATIMLFGFKTKFGGGKSTGFGLIYDSLDAVKKFEPRYRLVRAGLAEEKRVGRQQRKQRKNRAKAMKGKTKKGRKADA
mmetsp:Transcript_2990/g.3542  ORF Transcript_2990/g.3542 Transcript_2990/m.3542 type:complete len:133 (-) Transcript_2990:109-507(-)|eukprot:CAMPEP_0205821230 /NCGR_PEP_ID=MMETSP0206-20130828/6159_1 /ASSEMBLY_ACC=CAM_ASM_000279 /TAXON_ID=36767 /ORGANISM="Euplotes focardii, Strain TN1" /LENGTH=132 /DNA_ID=CAMNT_0053116533 /DNA_START=42 /DNA_END=440 /DNA_ORIENTATION=+